MPSPKNGIASDNQTDLELLAEVVKKTWSELKTGNREISLAIDQSSVFTRVLDMPQMSDFELTSSINWEAEEYIPLPINQMRIEWQVMGKRTSDNGEKRMDVLLIAVPRVLIDKYHKIIDLARLELKFLEPECVALMRTLRLFGLDKKLNVTVNFGDKKTDILVNSSGSIAFIRTVPSGGKAMTRAIVSSLNLSEEQAENYKMAYGFDKTKLDGALYNIILPIFEAVLEEIRRAVMFQQNKDPSKPITTLVICGAGSNLPGLNVLLSNALNMEVFIADPFSMIKPKNASLNIAQSANSKFLVPVGLAMNER